MAIQITFKSLTDEQKQTFIQFQAEIFKIQNLISEKQSQIEVMNGDIRNFNLEIAERIKLLKALEI